jgi:meiosis-specific protein
MSQENGAFDALSKRVLHAIQINISENAENPTHVVESYTFTFRYQSSAEGAKTLAGVTMQDPTGADTTVKNIKYALQMFIRKIVKLCEMLPELPGTTNPWKMSRNVSTDSRPQAKRYLHMQLYYTDDCDRNYEPPGFAPCKDSRLWFAQHDGWRKQIDDCGVFDAGYHAQVHLFLEG